MHYSIRLRCLLMIALFIYFLFASSSYFELLNPLFWCRTIFNNPDLLRWAGLTKICSFYWAPVAASVLTPNVFILLFFWDDRGSLRTASRLLGLGCELWDMNAHLRSVLKKRSAGFHFVAKECPNLNLPQGRSPCSFSRPESNVHGSWVQVDLCPFADVG